VNPHTLGYLVVAMFWILFIKALINYYTVLNNKRIQENKALRIWEFLKFVLGIVTFYSIIMISVVPFTSDLGLSQMNLPSLPSLNTDLVHVCFFSLLRN